MLLTVVFSFRNEEDVLEKTISEVSDVLETNNITYELIFVNDNSTDRSLQILKTWSGRDSRIRVINMSRRFGVSPCVMAGFRFAHGDAVIYMDTDLQDPPELIPKMVELYRNGVDVVHTVRTKRFGETAVKMWITKLAYKIINRLSDIQLIENAGDYKLLSRRVVDEIVKLNEYQPYTRGLIPWIGFRQEAISYERRARYAGKTKFSLVKSAGPFNEFIKGLTAFSEFPLYASLFVGFIVAIGAFIYLGVIVTTKIYGFNLPGWSAIMGIILLLGGITLITNGFIGIYIGRIFNNVKGRPSYIISDTIGFEEEKDLPTKDSRQA